MCYDGAAGWLWRRARAHATRARPPSVLSPLLSPFLSVHPSSLSLSLTRLSTTDAHTTGAPSSPSPPPPPPPPHVLRALQVVDEFREEDIDGAMLLELDDATLQGDLGVARKLDRKKILVQRAKAPAL